MNSPHVCHLCHFIHPGILHTPSDTPPHPSDLACCCMIIFPILTCLISNSSAQRVWHLRHRSEATPRAAASAQPRHTRTRGTAACSSWPLYICSRVTVTSWGAKDNGSPIRTRRKTARLTRSDLFFLDGTSCGKDQESWGLEGHQVA